MNPLNPNSAIQPRLIDPSVAILFHTERDKQHFIGSLPADLKVNDLPWMFVRPDLVQPGVIFAIRDPQMVNELKQQDRSMRIRTAQVPATMPVCDTCHKASEDVKFVVDPYQEDIHGVREEKFFCDQCYKDACDDI